jgi:hypothetical protein
MSFLLNSPAFTGNPTAPTPNLSDNSTSIATTAFVKNQGYLTGNQPIAITGDATGNGTTSIALTLAAAGTAGTYTKVTTDTKGRVISGSNISNTDVVNGLGYTPVDKAGDTMLGALILHADPIQALGAATKQYVDASIQGLSPKQSVAVATVGSNINLTGLQTLDGYAIQAGDRVLVKDQTNATQNGIYIAASGAWSRAADADVWAELPGAFVFVEGGTQNMGSAYLCTSPSGGTLGTSAISWSQFSSATSLIAGAGLARSGNTFSLALVTPQRALVSDASGLMATSAVTDLELSYLGGVTSAIQTQLNLLAPKASPALTGNPTAPTPAFGDNDTSIATTAFVQAAMTQSGDVLPIVTKSAAYTVGPNDYSILVDASGGAVVITLPASPVTGQSYNVKKIDASGNSVTISGNGKVIDGAATLSVPGQWQSYYIQYNGTSWSIL